MLRIARENKIYWLRAGMIPIFNLNAAILGSVLAYILICTMILLEFSAAYANENLEIQKAFNSVAKYIKADKKCKNFDVIEKKNDKFNIKILQSSGKSFSMYSILEEVKNSFESEGSETAISLLNQVVARFAYHKNALIGLGNIYYANKEYKRAIEVYIKLLKEYPGNSYILENFLTIISQYNPDLALSGMLKLYDIQKNYAPLLANLGLIYMKRKTIKEPRNTW
ncbi:tetratricopeptide repeat family protein [Wolbachia endosymbiont of Wuchereria bancrofti]|nr:tetratricopeptide repeat family protein [Wolbachia endosymbiont of Wuchereria bancrofti]